MDPITRDQILEVYIISARRLQARYKKTAAGTSHPYCKLTFGEHELSTEVIENDLNPKWKAKFEFTLNNDQDTLMFEIYDAKTKSLLGECNIPIAGHCNTPIDLAKEHWYPLSGPIRTR